MQEGGYTLRVREAGDNYVACLSVNYGDGISIDVKATVSVTAIAKLLNTEFSGAFGAMAGAGEDPEMVGWGFFKKIWKKVKKVAKKVAKSKVFKIAKKVFRSPIFKGIAAAIPGVNVAVGALTAADMAMQAAGKVYKSYKKVKRYFNKAKGIARRVKRAAFGQAKRRGVKTPQFRRAWKSGWNSVPNPRELAMIRRYRRSSQGRRMVRRASRAVPQFQRRYQQALPGFMSQYARGY